MKVYFRSEILKKDISKIYPKISYLSKINKLDHLYEYSIPVHLRKNICKIMRIPTFELKNEEVKIPRFTNFISKTIPVYKTKNFFYIQIPYEEQNKLTTLLHFLKDKHNLPCFVNGEFTNQDIPFIEKILDTFNENVYFKFSDLEFHYLYIEEIEEHTLKVSTHCLTENINFDLPFDTIKNKYFTVKEKDKEYTDISFKKYYRIVDKNLGLLSESIYLPKSIQKNDLVILN
jgi:hypothetical protein